MEWNEIFGYFNAKDLYDRLISEAPRGATIVEVGVFQGRSLAYLDKRSREHRPDLKIVGVDWGLGTATFGDGVGPTANKIATNMRDCGSKAIVILGESTNASRFFDDESIWAVFIDGTHTYEAVKADIEAWMPKVEKDGLVTGDDYNWEGVKRAVDEKFGSDVELMGVSWIHRK